MSKKLRKQVEKHGDLPKHIAIIMDGMVVGLNHIVSNVSLDIKKESILFVKL